jgi:two-component system sensor histidine kinase HydH
VGGVCAVLALAVTVLVLHNAQRNRQHVLANYLDRADALIWALEAGTRAWMAFETERTILQPLIEETAKQPGIVYMAVIDGEGHVIAHSDRGLAGSSLPPEAVPAGEPQLAPQWRIRDQDGTAVCEVYRQFAPLRGGFGGPGRHGPFRGGFGPPGPYGPHMGHRPGHDIMPPRNGPRPLVREGTDYTALVGFAHGPFAAAIEQDYHSTLLAAALVAALGIGGLLALFWAHGYRRSNWLLKVTRALADAVVSSLPWGLLTTDTRGRVTMINAAALSLLDIDMEHAMHREVRDIPGLDWDAALAGQLDGRVADRETTVVRGAESIPISFAVSPIRDEDGTALGQVFLLRDIAQMKRLQQEARRNERLAALGNLAAGVAHELRNPLSSIKGLAVFLAGKVASGAPTQAAKTMVQEVDRLDRVVTQLLDFSRPGSPRLARTDLNDVVRHTLTLASSDALAKNIEVDFLPETDVDAVAVLGDAEELTQALLNLVLNAIQSMDDGGTLRIRLERRPGDDGAPVVAMAVTDTGSGMTPEIQASIFTPYFTTKPSGTGLGLAIVRKIVESHGGRMEVESSPGQGSTFRVLLPAIPTEPGT